MLQNIDDKNIDTKNNDTKNINTKKTDTKRSIVHLKTDTCNPRQSLVIKELYDIALYDIAL